MANQKTYSLERLIERADKVNLSHSQAVEKKILTRDEAARQDLGQILTVLDARAQMGDLVGTPEQLKLLKSLIEKRAEASNLTLNENYSLFKKQFDQAFSRATEAIKTRRE